MRTNIAVALRDFDAWPRGRGAVALHGLMEDAATAEIARVQIWQWLRHRVIDRETVGRVLDEELAALGAESPLGGTGRDTGPVREDRSRK